MCGGAYARRDSNPRIHVLNVASLPLEYERKTSRPPGSNRIVRRTKAEPQAVRGGMATLPGFEPGSLGPGPSASAVELEGTE